MPLSNWKRASGKKSYTAKVKEWGTYLSRKNVLIWDLFLAIYLVRFYPQMRETKAGALFPSSDKYFSSHWKTEFHLPYRFVTCVTQVTYNPPPPLQNPKVRLTKLCISFFLYICFSPTPFSYFSRSI